jgi:hypothetical protein
MQADYAIARAPEDHIPARISALVPSAPVFNDEADRMALRIHDEAARMGACLRNSTSSC